MRFYVCVLLITVGNLAKSQELIAYKSKKYGYELSYPSDWIPDYPEEWNEKLDTFVKVPNDEVRIIHFIKKSKCAFEWDCKFNFSLNGGGSKKSYAAELEYLDRYQKHPEKTELHPQKVRLQQGVLKDQPYEIVLEANDLSQYKAFLYIYCKNIFYFAEFSTMKANVKDDNLLTDQSKSLSIETVYDSEKASIIKSFTCPTPEFFKKKKVKK